jgi:hypothetical protein
MSISPPKSDQNPTQQNLDFAQNLAISKAKLSCLGKKAGWVTKTHPEDVRGPTPAVNISFMLEKFKHFA